jgi:hypothetical protein
VQVLPPRESFWPNLQTLHKAEKACQWQTLASLLGPFVNYEEKSSVNTAAAPCSLPAQFLSSTSLPSTSRTSGTRPPSPPSFEPRNQWKVTQSYNNSSKKWLSTFRTWNLISKMCLLWLVTRSNKLKRNSTCWKTKSHETQCKFQSHSFSYIGVLLNS